MRYERAKKRNAPRATYSCNCGGPIGKRAQYRLFDKLSSRDMLKKVVVEYSAKNAH